MLDDLNADSLARLSEGSFNPCVIVETSAGNFQAWLKHLTRVSQAPWNLRGADLSLSLRRRPERGGLETVRQASRLHQLQTQVPQAEWSLPFVRLKVHNGEQYPMAEAFAQEITKLYGEREQEREARRLQASLSPQRGRRLSSLSLERFRTSTKYQDRPAAADIAFCVAAYANGLNEERIERALEDDYLSRDPSSSKRAAYIRKTMEKARRWAER